MARAARRAPGLAAVRFDMRGHGETGGRLDGRAIDGRRRRRRARSRPACRWRCAARAWAATSRSSPPRGGRRGGGRRDLPGPRAAAGARAARPASCEVAADVGGARGAAGRAPARGGGRRARPSRSCSSTPRATSGCPVAGSRALARAPAPPGLARWTSPRAATTARSSTTRPRRPRRCDWLRAVLGASERGAGARATRARRRAAASEPGAPPIAIIASATELRQRRARPRRRRCGAGTRQEALGARQHEVEREQAARARSGRAGCQRNQATPLIASVS